MLEIRRGKALAMIVESARVTDSDGSVLPLANLQEDGSYAEPEPEATEDVADDGGTDAAAESAESSEEPTTEPSQAPSA
jgi:trigger factor